MFWLVPWVSFLGGRQDCLLFSYHGISQVQNRAPSLYLALLPPHKVSPIRVDRLRKEASAHPDPRFVDYVLMGFQEGFCVGP